MCSRPSQASRMKGLLFQWKRGGRGRFACESMVEGLFNLLKHLHVMGRCFVTICIIHVANTHVI
jgi:hypothetical protein